MRRRRRPAADGSTHATAEGCLWSLQVACETATKTNMVMVFGEITTQAKVDYEAVVRKTCRDIGFTSEAVGLDADTCKVPSAHRPCSVPRRWLHGVRGYAAAGTKPFELIVL